MLDTVHSQTCPCNKKDVCLCKPNSWENREKYENLIVVVGQLRAIIKVGILASYFVDNMKYSVRKSQICDFNFI